MTGDPGNFITNSPHLGNDSVMIGNGNLLDISEVGTWNNEN